MGAGCLFLSIPKYHGVLVYPEVLCLEMACGRPVPLASTPGKTGFDAWSLKGRRDWTCTINYHQIAISLRPVFFFQENPAEFATKTLPSTIGSPVGVSTVSLVIDQRPEACNTVGGSLVSLFWWTRSCNNRQSLKAINDTPRYAFWFNSLVIINVSFNLYHLNILWCLICMK